MTKQTHSLRHALPALLLAGALWLPVRAEIHPPDTLPICPEEEEYISITVCEKMPEFPGGADSLFHYIEENMRYPHQALDSLESGRVILQFWIEKDGSVEDICICRGVTPALDAEAYRLVANMPRWKPAMQRGEPIRVRYTLPVNFKLASNYMKIDGEIIAVFGQGADKLPSFPGGTEALFEYLGQNIRYPQQAIDSMISGKVMVQFWILQNGKIEGIKVVRSVSPELDAEACRVIANMPRWEPATQRGEPVCMSYTLPVNFRLPYTRRELRQMNRQKAKEAREIHHKAKANK